jgi:hypothetical protein
MFIPKTLEISDKGMKKRARWVSLVTTAASDMARSLALGNAHS